MNREPEERVARQRESTERRVLGEWAVEARAGFVYGRLEKIDRCLAKLPPKPETCFSEGVARGEHENSKSSVRLPSFREELRSDRDRPVRGEPRAGSGG